MVYCSGIHSVYNLDGELLPSTGKILGPWKGILQGSLQFPKHSVQQTESYGPEVGLLITWAEVAAAVEQLCGCSVSGLHKIHPTT